MPVSEPCPARDQWQHLRRGEASLEEVQALTRHLEQCDSCVETVDRLESESVVPGPIPSLPIVAAEEAGNVVTHLIDRLKGWLPASPPKAEQIGQLGHYRLVRLLGSGGMGAVYLAQDELLPRQVAIKILLARPEVAPELPARFRREAEAIAQLKHANVVALYEIGTDQGRPYLVMEYVEGLSLSQRLSQAVLPAQQAAELLESLGRAVHAAHELGIVHRDLKPSNILLAADGTGKLADFGLARLAAPDGDHTRDGAVLGTPSYMPPEQAEGREVGPPADVYGLGAVLYECLTGRPPFLGATALETLDQVRRSEPVSPRQIRGEVPSEVEVICLKCLEKEPTRRYRSACELADDLRRYLDGVPIQARPAGTLERLVKWSRRKPAAAALVLVCAVFVLLAAIGGGWHYANVTAALKRAEEGETQAKLQRDRTTRQYREATATIGRMFALLAERKALQNPQLQAAQRAQVEIALAFFEQAVREQEHPAPEALLDLALFSGQLAHFQVHSGEDAAAEKNLRRAIAIYEPHVEKHPTDYKARSTLAGDYLYLGEIRHRAGQSEEAESFFRRTVNLLEALIRDDPDNAEHKDVLAEGFHFLGNLCLATKKPAAEWYEKAIAIRRERLIAEPKNSDHRAALAEHQTNLWQAYGRAKQDEKAIAVLKEAVATLEVLTKENPGFARYGASLGSARINLGATWLTRGGILDGLKEYTLGLEELQRVLKREPNYRPARNHLLPAHGGRAQCLTVLRRYSEALPEWDKVIELTDASSRPTYRLQRALVLARLAQFERAATDAEEVVKDAKGNPLLLYDSACVFGLCAAGDARKREEYASRAVALLEATWKAGHFDKPTNLAHVKKDTDLDSLRGREDYSTLLRRIEKPR